jgi:hypothetical protein
MSGLEDLDFFTDKSLVTDPSDYYDAIRCSRQSSRAAAASATSPSARAQTALGLAMRGTYSPGRATWCQHESSEPHGCRGYRLTGRTFPSYSSPRSARSKSLARRSGRCSTSQTPGRRMRSRGSTREEPAIHGTARRRGVPLSAPHRRRISFGSWDLRVASSTRVISRKTRQRLVTHGEWRRVSAWVNNHGRGRLCHQHASAANTEAPSALSRTVIARPIPDAAPVMSATFPSNRPIN